MTTQMTGLLIGGLLPALFFGLSSVFVRPATQAGISTGMYLTILGLTIATLGLGLSWLWPARLVSWQASGYTILVGVTWAIAAALVAIALTHYGSPLTKLVPLYNMNTLVAVLISLIVFSEWQTVSVGRLLLGALLIVIGGSLVATA